MAKMTPAMRSLCDGVMAKLDKAKDTLDVLVIARELQAKLGGLNPGNGKAKTNPGKGEGGTGESEGKGEGKGDKPSGNCSGKAPEGEGEGEGEGEASDKPEGESGTGAGTGIGKPGELQGDVTKVNPVDLVPVSQERLDQAAEIMKRAGDAQTEANVIDAIRESNRRAGKPLPALDEARSSGSLVADSMKAAKMRAQVARVLKAEESESWDRGRASGRLDRFALARVGAGHIEGVYAKRHISGGYETEIDVLVDASGSMTGAPMHCATLLAYVIAQAAQQVGVKCQVSLFSSMTATPRVAKATNESPSSKSVQRRFGEMAKGTNGSTPLTRSIIEIATKLAARSPQKRKMLFVVSDGGCDNGPGAVRKACDYAERLDVETVALCIDTAPHKGFKLAVRCNSANIAEAGLGVLVKALSREL
jgi:cobalamin biosynthesis protein CobT